MKKTNQAGMDISNLWHRIFKEGIIGKISDKSGEEMYGVYFDYEGDHTQSYGYIVGCKVESLEDLPEGIDSVVIKSGNYAHLVAKGKIPDCIVEMWQSIWKLDLNRAYGTDFEVYGPKSQDDENAEVDVYLSLE